jgi:tetratricopeptide (TPR) repeat protein
VGAGPDELLGGDDAAVRQALEGELARLRGAGALEALGLEPGADPAQVRSRFLQITRRYHPNRFARRSPEVSRCANEVFLLFRRAYEQARAPGEQGPARAPARQGPARAVTERLEQLDRLSPPSQPSLAVDAALTRRRRLRSHAANLTPAPEVLTAAELAARARQREERHRERLTAAVADLRAGRLARAREALTALLAEAPQDRAVRCALHYAIGREHHTAGRAAEARAEYQRVLTWDPDHQGALTSLELLADEPAAGGRGGILSRWFRK